MDLFKKLHVKMVAGMLLVISSILAILLVLLNFWYIHSNLKYSNIFMNELLLNDGVMSPRPKKIGPETLDHRIFNDKDKNNNSDSEHKDAIIDILNYMFPRNVGPIGIRNYFSTKSDKDGNCIEFVTDFPFDFRRTPNVINDSEKKRNYSYDIINSSNFNEDVKAIIKEVAKLNNNSGKYKGFMYARQKRDYGYFTVYLDRRHDIAQEKRLILFSLIVYGITLVISFFIAISITHLLIKPAHDAFIRQKRFISDAGHELKTPIAVIGANLDVIESDFPNNKWLGYIRAENNRMSKLVKDMLYLANTDANHHNLNVLQFDFSDAINIAVLPFESLIFEQGKKLEMSIAENMTVTGDEQKLKQLIIILVDNAIKNSDKGALIKVTAFQENSKTIVKVYNTGKGISEEDKKKIFERFYRADSSRNRNTGGYGLGLSIAQTIVNEHGGKITVNSKYGEWAEFTFIIPFSSKEKLLSLFD